MRFLKSHTIAVLFAAVIASTAFGMTIAMILTLDGGDDARDRDLAENVEPAPAIGRIAVCVQAVGASVSIEAKAAETLGTAMVEVAGHRHWADAFGEAPAEVDTGCPSGPASPVEEKYKHSIITWGQLVPEWSGYRTFVFVMPPEDLGGLMSELTPRKAPQETVCENELCMTASEAVYVRTDELENVGFLAWLLEEGVGLESRRAVGAAKYAGFEVP